jgi:predicted nucleic-acid-binding protein
MIIIDANVILRYLLNDIEEQSLEAANLIENNLITIRFEVIAEVVYVLFRVYKITKAEISDILIEFLTPDNIIAQDKLTLITSLRYYSSKKLDFVDLVLLAYAEINDANVFTFDRKLNREIRLILERK